jgi:hypothetical protein
LDFKTPLYIKVAIDPVEPFMFTENSDARNGTLLPIKEPTTMYQEQVISFPKMK